MANIIQTFPKGSGGTGGGGHTILNTDGTSVAQESKLQFIGADVTDDSTNGITKVAGAGLNQDSLDDITAGASTPTNVQIGDANNYSTTEKVIGQWIDGKPLYQKTLEFDNITLTGSTQTNFGTLTGLNIGSYANVVETTANEADDYFEGLGYFACWIRLANNNFGMSKNSNSTITYKKVWVTIRYTKATD